MVIGALGIVATLVVGVISFAAGIFATLVVGALSFMAGILAQKKANKALRDAIDQQFNIMARAFEEAGLAEFNRDSYDKLLGTFRCARATIEARSSVRGTATVIKSGEKK